MSLFRFFIGKPARLVLLAHFLRPYQTPAAVFFHFRGLAQSVAYQLRALIAKSAWQNEA